MSPAPRNFVTLLPVLAFLFVGPMFAFAASLAGPALDRREAHRLVDDLRLPDRAGGLLLRLWFDQERAALGGDLPAHLQHLSPSTWETVAADLLPPDWLAAETHRAVDAAYDWLAGDDPWPAVQINLSAVRDRLRSPAGANALLPLLAEARACLPGELAPVEAGVFVPCLPPDANLEALARQTAQVTADEMPPALDVPTLAQIGAFTPETGAQLDQARRWVRWTTSVLRLWGEVCLMLLAAHALLTARTWIDLVESPVQPLGLAGAVTLLLAPLLYGLAFAVSRSLFGPLGAEDSIAAEIVGYWGRAAALRLALWAVGAVAVAVLAGGVGRLLRRGRAGDAPTPVAKRRGRR